MRPEWNGADKHKLREPLRDMIREELPEGTAGFVAEDLDLIIRHWGPNYGLDDIGRFRFVEVKHGKPKIDDAQRYTFTLIDDTCRRGDLDGTRYDGFYIVGHNAADAHAPETIYKVNRLGSSDVLKLTRPQFIRWLDTADTTTYSSDLTVAWDVP